MTSLSLHNMITNSDLSFEDKALLVYQYQYENNPSYRQFVDLVRYNDFQPHHVEEIPFFPISLFKEISIKTGAWESELTFTSSGTTQMVRSQHYVKDGLWYLNNTEHIWQDRFGSLNDYAFLSLLPNYHDNPSSSLLYMIRHFMLNSQLGQENYFIEDHQGLHDTIERLKMESKRVVLFGVSFALLDYVEQYKHVGVDQLIVVETGGMKKNRREITRRGLHDILSAGFGGATIASEYGMTECLSQLYCTDGFNFLLHDRMRVLICDPTDPGTLLPTKRRGRINIIDLANIDTLSFIATDDLGQANSDNEVEILGRLDASDLRGCNYLI